MFYKDGTRFPESGWLSGTPADLADIARLVSVPQSAVDKAADPAPGRRHRPRRGNPERLERAAPGDNADGRRAAGNVGCAADAPHGLRHHRQRDGVSRPRCGHSRRHQAAAPRVQSGCGESAARNRRRMDAHSRYQLAYAQLPNRNEPIGGFIECVAACDNAIRAANALVTAKH